MEKAMHYDPKAAEKKWQIYWEKEGINKFSPKSRAEVYSVDTPPPTVSGNMHLGHAFSYAQADFIVRYHKLLGKNIFYPFGFDDNGLATERFVEKKIGKRATDMPRQEFIRVCLNETKEVEKKLKEDWASLGICPDWGITYRTIDDYSRKTSQKSFLDIYKMGRAYQKEAPTIWCPECQTAIAQVELEDREFESFFLDLNFELENKKNIVIATTRPEFLPACVAVFVHPEDKKNRHLAGKKAKVPLFNQLVPIIADERADPEKGTGIVMCCTFGDQTDAEWWKAYKLPLRTAITPDGKMSEAAGEYRGLPIKEARKRITDNLMQKGIVVNKRKIRHVVNVHERCGTEIEFLVTKQWFIKYLDLKEKFLELGKKLKWHPEHMRHRYEGWINGLQWDWCISRQRYFGVPFPVWYCSKCGEAMTADERDLPVDPLGEKPKKACKCGSKEFTPEKDVLDTWATSSLTPQIAARWVSDRAFFKKMFPMTLRTQAHDIISFWLFNTVVKAWLHEKKLPWKAAVIHGWALDEKGKKMSKSKGNVIDPKDMINKYSSDALRFWAASCRLGDDLWFSEKEFVSGQRTVTKLWNAARFAIMHLEDYDSKKPEKLELMDKWMLSRLSEVIKTATGAFENCEYIQAKLETEKFFWQDLCNNYLEIIKDRMYSPEKYSKNSRKSAQFTLYKSLLSVLKLFSPIMPHITEECYHLYFAGREKKRSIHEGGWPQYEKELADREAEQTGNLAVQVISAVRKYKSSSNMSLKAEISKLVIGCGKAEEKKLKLVEADIKAATKAKELAFGKGKIKIDDELSITIE